MEVSALTCEEYRMANIADIFGGAGLVKSKMWKLIYRKNGRYISSVAECIRMIEDV